MPIKFKTDKRLTHNLTEPKSSLRRDWYIIGTDGKKSYVTTVKDALITEARNEANSWAKKNGLTVEVVRATK